MQPIRLVSGFLTVGVWTFGSRILGFVRDILIAAYLGAGPVAEAFFVAFSLPNLFRRFFAEGAFNMAFVPMFSKRLETGEDAEGFAQDAFSGLAGVLVVFSLVAIMAMPLLVAAMASGFIGDARFAMAVYFGRYVFIYVLFISLAALMSGVLNATGRFAAAAAAPILLNVILVAALLLATALGTDATLPGGGDLGSIPGVGYGTALSLGVIVAGIAQFALLRWATARAGFRLTITRPRLTPELKRLAIVAAPAALAGGVVQINLLVGRQVASFFEGAVAWMSIADRLYQLPLGVVGIAVGIVLLPDLSRRLGSGDAEGGQAAFNRATEFSLLLTVPAAVALCVIPVPLVAVLFERGAFTRADTEATALLLAIYGAGLPAFVLQKVLQPLYFAREDTRTPFRFALVGMLVNAVLAVGLAGWLGYPAAALGTTVSGWAMVALLWRGTRGFGDAAALDARSRARLGRIVAASAIMGAALFAAARSIGPALTDGPGRILLLAALILGGMAVYFAAAVALGAMKPAELRASLRRQR